MLHRQLRNALEEIFGTNYVTEALEQREVAQLVLYDRPEEFKKAVLGFQRLNFRDEHASYATELERELGFALVCSLIDNDTRELVAELGLNYL
jgi:hypothetical protein